MQTNDNKIAVLFAGQGAQAVGMGKDIYAASDKAKGLFDAADKLMPGVADICFDGEPEQLKKTEFAQPCLFLAGLAFANELKDRDVTVDAVAGFSLGEIPALAYSGVLSEEDAFRLVLARAKKMAELSEKHEGGMIAALKLDGETIERLCADVDDVWPVNYNCPGQISCSGAPDKLDILIERIKASGGRAVKLAVSGAFHTPYMQDAAKTLEAALSGMDICAPSVPLYSNRTGALYPSDSAGIVENISKQVCSPVRWDSIVRSMYAAGIRTFIEVGAGSTLTGFVKRTLEGVSTYTVTDVASLDAAVDAIKHGGER